MATRAAGLGFHLRWQRRRGAGQRKARQRADQGDRGGGRKAAIDLPPKKWTGLSRSAFHLGGADIA
ncbi:hypothetical protein, partial [Caulobacter segnis]|uniref:hypothetical protein n=1 Tax=Caulobacter segnis TaxID=88688 RepID=UPI0026E99276